MNRYQSNLPSAQASTVAPSYADKQFLHSFIAGAALPLLQALITALMCGGVVTIIAWMIFDVIDPWKYGVMIFLIVLVAMWIYLQGRWLSLTAVEKWIQVDLDHNGVIGKKEPERVRVEVHDDGGGSALHVDIVDLPASVDQLRTFAQGLLAGMGASEKYWTGKGKLFSKQEFRDLRGEMVKRGLLAYINPGAPLQGYELTKAGRAVMRKMVDFSPIIEGETVEGV